METTLNKELRKPWPVIRSVKPDIVLLQESYDIDGDRPLLGEWLAGELSWNQHQAQSAHLCVLTPLEMEATFFHHAWHGVGARLRDAHGRELLAWSIWIDYRASIGHELRDNPTMSDETLSGSRRCTFKATATDHRSYCAPARNGATRR